MDHSLGTTRANTETERTSIIENIFSFIETNDLRIIRALQSVYQTMSAMLYPRPVELEMPLDANKGVGEEYDEINMEENELESDLQKSEYTLDTLSLSQTQLVMLTYIFCCRFKK